MELQKPVDRRFKSDHPHALAALATVILLLLLPGPALEAVGTSASRFRGCVIKGVLPILVPDSTRVALVMPVFTSTPYSQYMQGSFYAFYHKYASQDGNITTDLDWLSTSVASGLKLSSGWGNSFPLYEFLNSTASRNCGLVMGRNLHVVSDINVTQGALSSDNCLAKFDAVVVGFSEYVTKGEYTQFVNFVSHGGKLVLMSSDAFQVMVDYNRTTGKETYVSGHGFAFNGKSAWRSSARPFDISSFIGSVDCCFRNGNYSGAIVNATNTIGAKLGASFGNTVFKSYIPHEENSVTNRSHTSIIATFQRGTGPLVAAYVHQYGKGEVVCLCVFGDDIILSDSSAQYFALLAIGTPNTALQGRFIDVQETTPWAVGIVLGVATAALGVAIILGRKRATSGGRA